MQDMYVCLEAKCLVGSSCRASQQQISLKRLLGDENKQNNFVTTLFVVRNTTNKADWTVTPAAPSLPRVPSSSSSCAQLPTMQKATAPKELQNGLQAATTSNSS